MHEFDGGGGDRWSSTVDDLAIVRWTAATGGATLVRLRLTNDRESALAVRLVEELPDAATDTVLITTTGDQADNWHRVGDWIVHEFAIPAGGKRTTAYLLRSEDEPPLALDPPDVNTVVEIPDPNGADVRDVLDPMTDASIDPEVSTGGDGRALYRPSRDRSSPSANERSSSPDNGAGTARDGRENVLTRSSTGVALSTGAEGTADTNGTTAMNEYKLPRKADEQPSTAEDQPEESEPESLVEDLLVALEEEATPAQLRSLRSKLGASESERAKIEYVQTRLGDLAAYIDALEALVDEHGTEVIDDLRDSIEENATSTEALREEIAGLEATVARVSDETDESIDALEADVAAMESGLDERLESLESSIEATRSALSSVEDDLENDRLARAKEVRRFDESLTEVDETVARLQKRIGEFEAFRDRITNALTGSERPVTNGDRSTPVESDLPSSD